MKKKHRVFVAFIIDLSIIYCIASIFSRVISVGFYPTLLITYLIYNTFFFLSRERTYGKDIVGIDLLLKNNDKLNFIDFFRREFVLKLSVGFFIPSLIILFVFPLYSIREVVIITFFIFIFIISVWCIFFKEFWWNIYSHSKHIDLKNTSRSKTRYKYMLIFILYFASFSFNVYQYNKYSTDRVESYFNNFHNNIGKGRLAKYVEFLQESNEESKEYVLKLFDKYDYVIICERQHNESTQWQLIYDICSDIRFIKKVGNVYTEYGSFSKQENLNTFLKTKYYTQENLNRNTARLMRNVGFNWPIWTNTNFFNFLKKINMLNGTLPDPNKINICFSDIMVDWQNIRSIDDYEKYSNLDRDKIMADHIIQRIKENKGKKKSLIILNSRHAFNNYPNAGYYIFKAFPEKTANVFLNSVSMKFGPFYSPINDGLWDAAFEQVGNKNVGFNLENSPFGSAFFDLYPSSRNVKFQDVFSGFVFYKPLKAHYREEGYPFMFDGFQEEYINRVKASGKSKEEAFNTISFYTNNPYLCDDMKYGFLANFVDLFFSVFLFFLSIVYLFYYFILEFILKKQIRLYVKEL